MRFNWLVHCNRATIRTSSMGYGWHAKNIARGNAINGHEQDIGIRGIG